jgi:hypothetical protein
VKRYVATALVALGVACQSAADAPKDPVWGKQACSNCAMLVSEPHFAAQLLTPAGDHLYFDDVGCMAAFLARKKPSPQRAWVRDPGGNWVTTELAHFSKGAKTPMDYGFEFSETGELSWDAVRAAVRERPANGGER